MMQDVIKGSPLGKKVAYESFYNPKLLYPIARKSLRKLLFCGKEPPFHGFDLWNAYELSWLDLWGKPQIAMAAFSFPADSPFIIESKSLKFYLASFHQTKLASKEHFKAILVHDLSKAVAKEAKVSFVEHLAPSNLQGQCIDHLNIKINNYRVNPELLQCAEQELQETLVSHLFKSNCPVTGQADWASVQIRYSGKKILAESLLRYLLSFRQEQCFHEHCVERIFVDLLKYCQPKNLSVYARYTRRGGLDINPFRSNFEHSRGNDKTFRQ